jgi:hypothetical protein
MIDLPDPRFGRLTLFAVNLARNGYIPTAWGSIAERSRRYIFVFTVRKRRRGVGGLPGARSTGVHWRIRVLCSRGRATARAVGTGMAMAKGIAMAREIDLGRGDIDERRGEEELRKS